jgi:phosphonate transport system substrate-binding protein
LHRLAPTWHRLDRFGALPARAPLALLLAVAFSGRPALAEDPASTERVSVGFGLTKSMFADVNENDAAAAVSVYLKTLGQEFGIDARPYIFAGSAEMAKALQQQEVDILGISATEYFELEKEGLEGPLLLSVANDSVTEEYVLLVRDGGPIEKAEDLRGTSLIVANEIRAALAPMWLEVFLRQRGLGSTSQVFGKVSSSSKPTQVLLPVFFGKADACLVRSGAWDLMAELNPQVKTQLRALAMSPPIIPGFTCFRRGISPALKRRILETSSASHTTPSFKQVMALFKVGKLVERPLSALDGTRELVSAYRALAPRIPAPPQNSQESRRPAEIARP